MCIRDRTNTGQSTDNVCCSTDEKVNQKSNERSEAVDKNIVIKMFLPGIISLVLLLIAIYLDNALKPEWFQGWVRTVWYIIDVYKRQE